MESISNVFKWASMCTIKDIIIFHDYKKKLTFSEQKNQDLLFKKPTVLLTIPYTVNSSQCQEQMNSFKPMF